MKIKLKDFRARDARIDLAEWPTRVGPHYKSKQDYERILDDHRSRLTEAQARLYAHGRYAVLVIFQGMDAAGKDGAIKHVMSGLNPLGCRAYAFKQPNDEELQHDFLWRTTRRLPQRGHIGIFNRSYYEEVLVVRVHPEVLRAEPLPQDVLSDGKIWRHRFTSINHHEKHLHRNGTRIVKIFLHISRDEQARRLLQRMDDPQRNWKFSMADVQERTYWSDYQRAYADCIAQTSTKFAPWYIVPADDKKNARLIVSQVLLETLAGLDITYPKLDAARRRELQSIRKELTK
ncbi:MAG TPA: ADP-polyphosphate phosphotransferase [Terriglobales bacterium]|nr:ADP-polyphosphate phosphotransferase [Terriglobales bacterium]